MAVISRINVEHCVTITLSTGESMDTHKVWSFQEFLPGVAYSQKRSSVADQFGPATRTEHNWKIADEVVIAALCDFFTDEEIESFFPSVTGQLPSRDLEAIAAVNQKLRDSREPDYHRCINVRNGDATIWHGAGYYTKWYDGYDR